MNQRLKQTPEMLKAFSQNKTFLFSGASLYSSFEDGVLVSVTADYCIQESKLKFRKTTYELQPKDYSKERRLVRATTRQSPETSIL